MAEINSGLGWSEAQWEIVNSAVTEGFAKASVAEALLDGDCYGPLAESEEYVRKVSLKPGVARVAVEDDETLKLFNLTVKVELSSEQVAEGALSSALLAFRRAANTLAQVEDDLVFNGFDAAAAEAAGKQDPEKLVRERDHDKKDRDAKLKALKASLGSDSSKDAKPKSSDPEPKVPDPEPKVQKAEAKKLQNALQNAETKFQQAERLVKDNRNASIVVAHPDTLDGLAKVDLATRPVAILQAQGIDVGEQLVAAVVQAVTDLEDDSHPAPFVCVLGSNLFEEAHRPVPASMVLPADRIRELLKGPLLRSGQMDKDTGIIVSRANSEIDIVVATPPRVQFLLVNEDAKYLFRVYEKFMLRIKDPTAVQFLDLTS